MTPARAGVLVNHPAVSRESATLVPRVITPARGIDALKLHGSSETGHTPYPL